MVDKSTTRFISALKHAGYKEKKESVTRTSYTKKTFDFTLTFQIVQNTTWVEREDVGSGKKIKSSRYNLIETLSELYPESFISNMEKIYLQTKQK